MTVSDSRKMAHDIFLEFESISVIMSSIAFWKKQWRKMSDNLRSTNLSPLFDDIKQEDYIECEASDKFLNLARKTWFPDFKQNDILNFTVEKISKETQADLDKGTDATGVAMTRMSIKDECYTGKPSIYFNKKYAFKSQKTLFFAMAHKLLHASQYLCLANKRLVLNEGNHELIIDIMDFFAYQFEIYLGRDMYLASFEREQLEEAHRELGDVFFKLQYSAFQWTTNVEFVKIELK